MGLIPETMVTLKTDGKTVDVDLGLLMAIDLYYPASIRVESVNDSRCPTGPIDCAWEGNAEVKIYLATGKDKYEFTLHTSPRMGDRSIEIEGFEVVLMDVSPYPSVYDTSTGEPPVKTVTLSIRGKQ